MIYNENTQEFDIIDLFYVKLRIKNIYIYIHTIYILYIYYIYIYIYIYIRINFQVASRNLQINRKQFNSKLLKSLIEVNGLSHTSTNNRKLLHPSEIKKSNVMVENIMKVFHFILLNLVHHCTFRICFCAHYFYVFRHQLFTSFLK